MYLFYRKFIFILVSVLSFLHAYIVYIAVWLLCQLSIDFLFQYSGNIIRLYAFFTPFPLVTMILCEQYFIIKICMYLEILYADHINSFFCKNILHTFNFVVREKGDSTEFFILKYNVIWLNFVSNSDFTSFEIFLKELKIVLFMT